MMLGGIVTLMGNSIDPDAYAYLTAMGIQNDGTIYYPSTAFEIPGYRIWHFTNRYFIQLKAAGLYSKTLAMWLYQGGTAATNKFNAKDPRDLDIAHRLTYAGGITHGGEGITFNGTNGIADTKFNANTLTLNSTGMHIYVRNNVSLAAAVDMGASVIATTRFLCLLYTGTSTNSQQYNNTTGSLSVSNSIGTGLFSFVRVSATDHRIYRNGVQIGSTQTTGGGSLPNSNIAIGGLFTSGLPTAGNYSSRNHCFGALTSGMTPAEVMNYYTINQEFQTGLNRNV